MNGYFKKQIEALRQRHEALLQRPNEMQEETCENVKDVGQYIARIDEMIERKQKLFAEE